MKIEKNEFTTGEVASLSGKHPQTLSKWAKEGFLEPTGKPKHWPARYCLTDMVAVSIASTSLEIGIKRKVVKKIVKAVQRSDPDELEHALIFTAKSETNGMMRHYWCADTRDTEEMRFIQMLRDGGQMINEGSLLSIVDTTLKHLSKMLDIGVLAGLSKEAD